MTERIWHSGPPPHVGWWLCSSGAWHWWDGSEWGVGAYDDEDGRQAAMFAAMKIGTPQDVGYYIRWCDYWPANARVPRVARCIPISKATHASMVAGGGLTHPRVIYGGKVREWIGIGWLTLCLATPKDYANLPVCVTPEGEFA